MKHALRALGLAAMLLAMTDAANSQGQRAHVHGQIQLDVVVEGPAVTIALSAPLDSLLGFERAPRNPSEQRAVQAMVAQLRQAEQVFRIDPAGGCKQGPIELDAPVVGLGSTGATPDPKGGHADLEASFGFNCASATQARFIELGLFAAFKDARQIDAQIVTPGGQFKRTLRRPASRLAWDK